MFLVAFGKTVLVKLGQVSGLISNSPVIQVEKVEDDATTKKILEDSAAIKRAECQEAKIGAEKVGFFVVHV